LSNKHKGLFTNIAWLGVVQIANYAFPLISIPIISRIIGPDKFGVINYSTAFVAYFILLISYGFDLTATRRVAQDPNNFNLRNQVFSEVLNAKILLFLISAVLFIIGLYIFPPLSLEKKVAVFSFLACIGAILTQNWLFQAMQDLPKVAILNLISKLLFSLGILAIVHKKDDYIWIPLLTSMLQISFAVLSLIWAYNRYQLKFKFLPLKLTIAFIISERAVFLTSVVTNLYTTTNIIILGLLQNEAQVGYYTAGQRLMDVVSNIINMPLSQALYPFLSLAFRESKENGILVVQKLTPLIVFFTLAMSVVMFFIGPTLLILFFGNTFEPSIAVFRILVFIPLVISVNNIFCIQIMLNLKMDNIFFKITLIGAILSVSSNLLMSKHLGYIGTAWNWLIVEIFVTVAAYIALKNRGIKPIDIQQFKISNIISQLTVLFNTFQKKTFK
jgi:O-antigen/teichoic acid export membrane protein